MLACAACTTVIEPDAGFDASTVDAGTRDAAAPLTHCDPLRGVECDGDWSGRCPVPCADDACCAPRGGRFLCLGRNEDGSCPAADLFVDPAPIESGYVVSTRFFRPESCSIVEACVGGPGYRRLLRFDSWTPNTGSADVYVGPPAERPELFEYSECHDHDHFTGYARYSLLDAERNVVASGHKQAFCILDWYRYPGEDPRGLHYTCEDQGLQVGYQDVYARELDCQWVDVTDVAPGDYLLHIELNYAGLLLEEDYENNVLDVAVTVPPDDVARPCPDGALPGLGRDCGLTRNGRYTCAPETRVRVGCSSLCGVGSCTGDPFLRVCEAEHDPGCDPARAIVAVDRSDCGPGDCSGGADCCPMIEIECPPSGELVVYSGAYDPALSASCDVVVEPVP